MIRWYVATDNRGLSPCGDRVKTDRRDARKLLMMFKAGLLTEVHAPDEHQEAVRELAGFIWFTVTQYHARKNTNDAA